MRDGNLLPMPPKLLNLVAPAFLIIAATLGANAADAPKKRDINLDDLAKLQRVSGPVVSPDGEWVLYTVGQIDTKEDKSQSHLWMVKWDGSVHLQLTYGKEGAGSPKFSPDGRYISFTSSRPGTVKGDQVWVMDRRGGEAEQLTNITDQNIQGYSWSPDSKKLLLTLHPKAEPDPEEGKPPAPPKPIVIDRYHFKQDIQGYLRDDAYNALYLWDLTTKKAEKLTSDKNVNENEAEWSPDGMWIAFVSNHDPDPDRSNNTDVFVVEAKAGSSREEADDVERAGRRATGVVAGLEVDCLHAGREDRVARVFADQAGRGDAGWKGELSGGEVRSRREPAIFSADGHLSYLVADDRNEYPAEVELGGQRHQARTRRSRARCMAWDQAAGHTAVLYTNDTSPGRDLCA